MPQSTFENLQTFDNHNNLVERRFSRPLFIALKSFGYCSVKRFSLVKYLVFLFNNTLSENFSMRQPLKVFNTINNDRKNLSSTIINNNFFNEIRFG